MKLGKHYLVADMKISLVVFFLVMFLVVFISYGAINNGFRSYAGEKPLGLNLKFLGNVTNLNLPVFRKTSQKNRTSSVRILCLILTLEKDISTRLKAVNDTWVRRCDKHLYLLNSKQQQHDFLNLNITETRNNIVHKIRSAYAVIYHKYIKEFDWILKSDDDTYVIVENLRYLLSKHNPNEPGHLGYLFKKFLTSGYMSGGAGYVISNTGFRMMLEKGLLKENCSIPSEPEDPESSEDVETGRCLEKVGVPVISSLDSEGRETFHPYPPYKHLVGPLPSYIVDWGKNPVIVGERCCSRYSVTFHYLSPHSIYRMEEIVYKSARFLNLSDNQGIPLSLEELKAVSY